MFKLFFSKYTLWGFILILLSIILNDILKDNFIFNIISNCMSTIGTALLLGAIFDFSKNSSEFVNFISDIIKRNIISKDFIEKLDSQEKQDVLKMTLIPSETQIEQYSSINNYYKQSIESLFCLKDKPFKTNVTLTLFAEIKDDKVICTGNISYRRYKNGQIYQPISTYLEKDESSISNCYILLPNGERYNFTNDDIQEIEDDIIDGVKVKKGYKTIIPQCYNIYPYITICKEIKEFGYDHWMIFNWTSLTPCDGIYFELRCTDGLVIKESKVFDNQLLYKVILSEDKHSINIVSNSWLDEYTGFSILVSK